MAVLDDFNRANSNLNSGNWGTPTGAGTLRVVSNQGAGPAAGGAAAAYWTAVLGNDQWARKLYEAGTDFSPAVRMATGSMAWYEFNYDAGSLGVYRTTNGSTFVQVGSLSSATPSANQAMELQVSGSTLKAYWNPASPVAGVPSSGTPTITGTDISFVSGKIGSVAYDSTARWDNFDGGTLSSAQALSGSSPSSSWGEAGALGEGPAALSGAAPASTWGEAGTLGEGPAALAGAAPSSAWGEAGALGEGRAALSGAAPSSTWGEAGALGEGPVGLSGAAPASAWGEAGTLSAGAQALSGAAPASAWGEAGSLGEGPAALSGASPGSTWGEAGTLTPGPVGLSGAAPASTWGEGGQLAAGGSPAADVIPEVVVRAGPRATRVAASERAISVGAAERVVRVVADERPVGVLAAERVVGVTASEREVP